MFGGGGLNANFARCVIMRCVVKLKLLFILSLDMFGGGGLNANFARCVIMRCVVKLKLLFILSQDMFGGGGLNANFARCVIMRCVVKLKLLFIFSQDMFGGGGLNANFARCVTNVHWKHVNQTYYIFFGFVYHTFIDQRTTSRLDIWNFINSICKDSNESCQETCYNSTENDARGLQFGLCSCQSACWHSALQ